MKIISLELLCLTLLLSPQVFAAKKVVATINGAKISKADFERTYKQNMLFVSNKKVTKEKVLNDLISRELGIQRAKKAKLDRDPTVKRKMEDVLYHAQISKDIEPMLKTLVVSDAEVKKYYANHNEYRTAHILFRMQAIPDAKENRAALEQALKVYTALVKKPEKFAEYANKYSQSTNAQSGGDIGFLPAMRLAPEYWAAIKNKSVGTIIKPIKTQFGWEIIKILGIKSIKNIDMNLYKKIVYDQKRDAILANYFKSLRKGATIKIAKEHLK